MKEPEEFKPNCQPNIPDHRPILESLEPLVPPAGIANPAFWYSLRISGVRFANQKLELKQEISSRLLSLNTILNVTTLCTGTREIVLFVIFEND